MNASQQTIEERIKSVWGRCDPEVQNLIDDLYGWAEAAETQMQVLDMRIKKEWMPYLYTQKEVEEMTRPLY